MIFKIALLGFALFCSSSTGWATERFPFLGQVTGDKVSVRAGQNVNFERVDLLTKGTQVLVLEEQFGWYKIQLPSTSRAYVRVDYLAIEGNQIGKISGNRLNVRAGKGVNFSSLGQLNKGDYVRILSKADDWFEIQSVEGLYGWVNKDYVTLQSYSIPSLDSLGLKKIDEQTIESERKRLAENHNISGMVVSLKGTLKNVPSEDVLSGYRLMLVGEDKTIYYLKVDPDIAQNFVNKMIRLEGHPLVKDSSLTHGALLVRSLGLIL